ESHGSGREVQPAAAHRGAARRPRRVSWWSDLRAVKPKLKRLIWFAIAGAALYFVVQGGEYGTTDLVRQRMEKRRLAATIDSLESEVDSLRKFRKAVETDPKTQE